MRGVEDETHEDTAEGTSNGDGHDPGKQQEANSLEVDCLDSSVAKTDANGGASNAHGSGDRERVLREEKDGDSGAHLHRATSAGRVVGDLVTHNYFIAR